MPVLLSHSSSLLPIFSNIEYFDSTMDGIVILSAIDEHPMIPNFRLFLIIRDFFFVIISFIEKVSTFFIFNFQWARFFL